MSISRHIRAILTVTMLAAGLGAVAVTLAGGEEPDPVLHGKVVTHGEPGFASATPAVPTTKVVEPGASLGLSMSKSLQELDGAMRRGDSAAVVALWQRTSATCVKGGRNGSLCADSPGVDGTLVTVEVVRNPHLRLADSAG